MEIILLQEVEKLGSTNELVNVKPGYARNYLIPRKLAIVATKGNKKVWEENVRQRQAKEQEALDTIRAVADKLKKAVIKVGAKVGEEGKIFGSITPLQLVKAIKSQTNCDIDRKQIEFVEAAKSVGAYHAKITLHKDVEVTITYEVEAE